MKNANKNNPFLKGNYAPVHDELDVDNLQIIGQIPSELEGAYMRNGPNPLFPPISYTFPFDGDGMIHAIYIADGKAHYRNRFVKTKGYLAEKKAGKAIYGGIMHPIMPDPKLIGPDGDPGPFKNGAFIHIIRHAGHYLAMWEGGPAYEMDIKLGTLGEWQPIGSKKPIPVVPHTRFDPKTGELWLINYDIEPPYLSVYQIDKQGKLQTKVDIDKPYSTMMHDFLLTENYVIFYDCPVVFDADKLMSGKDIISWKPELGVRIGVMHRKTHNIEWFHTDAFFVFHFANAYENKDEIIIDFVRHPYLEFIDSGNDEVNHTLFRTKLNLSKKTVANEQLDDRHIEFPRIKETQDTLQHRFVYTPGKMIEKTENFHALIKYDVETQSTQIHDFGSTHEIGEAVFVPRKNATHEDDGYLMLFVYDKTENNSEFVILNAAHLSDQPIARVKLPRRIPHGLHGTWMEGPWRK